MFIMLFVTLVVIAALPFVMADKRVLRDEQSALESITGENNMPLNTKVSFKMFRNNADRIHHATEVLSSKNVAQDINRHKEVYGDDAAFNYLVATTIRVFAVRFLPGSYVNDTEIISKGKFFVTLKDSTVMTFTMPYITEDNTVRNENYLFKLYPSTEEALLDGDHSVIYDVNVKDFDEKLMSEIDKQKRSGVPNDFLLTADNKIATPHRFVSIAVLIADMLTSGHLVAQDNVA